MPVLPVSVIVVTRNEESRIARCLEALSGFDDIIVVDSASTDATAGIAARMGARVVNFVWDGAYPKKRQWCLDHVPVRHDFIFFVDADEIVTPALVREIAKLRFDCAGYFVTGRYIWQGRRLRYGAVNNKLALLDRRKMMFPVVNDLDLPGMGELEGHYQPVRRPEHRSAPVGRLRPALLHDAAADPAQWLDRHRRYAAWERGMNDRAAWPVDPVLWRQWLKRLFRRMARRDIVAFVHGYVLKGGILDGRAGLDFARKRAAYYRMISY